MKRLTDEWEGILGLDDTLKFLGRNAHCVSRWRQSLKYRILAHLYNLKHNNANDESRFMEDFNQDVLERQYNKCFFDDLTFLLTDVISPDEQESGVVRLSVVDMEMPKGIGWIDFSTVSVSGNEVIADAIRGGSMEVPPPSGFLLRELEFKKDRRKY